MELSIEHSLKVIIELIAFGFVISLLSVSLFGNQIVMMLERLI
ncbi:MAG: hypothetical protein RR623_04715 [Bacilli bacterium]